MKSKLRTALVEASNMYGQTMTSAMASLMKEDIGWQKVGGDTETSDSVPLPVIKEHSIRARRLVGLNPLVKRGTVVRNAYMWADMPDYSNLSDTVVERNNGEVFNAEARSRDEVAFTTDGMVVYVIDKRTKMAHPVPIKRVSAVARAVDAGDEGDLYAFLVEPVPVSANVKTTELDRKAVWIVVDGKHVSPVSDPDHETDTTKSIVYAMVNRQTGEQWGKPDLMGAVYWAQAYKEYLEAAHTMAKALARIAFKVQSLNSRQQAGIIQQMSGAVGTGGTASLGAGQELTAVGKSGAGLDFAAATPLAAMVSASLDVPLSVLLTDGSAGGRQGAETALEDPTFKAFDLRKQVHVQLLTRIATALGEKDPQIRVGTLNNDLVQRRMQSINLALASNMLWDEEARSLTLEVLRPANARPADELPPKTAPATAVATGGNSTTGVGPLSDGTNADRDTDETVA